MFWPIDVLVLILVFGFVALFLIAKIPDPSKKNE